MQAAGLTAAVVVLLAVQWGCADGYNITTILEKYPSLSLFNHYLTLTDLAAEINRRRTITVCALDNAAMAGITSNGYSIYTIRNILSLHVLVDYYGAKKLHQISNRTTVTATMFQATGMAPGNSGYVNITDLPGGKVGFNTADNAGDFTSFYVKPVYEKPYNISIVQISSALTSSAADAPMASPASLNLPSVLSSRGCKAFSTLLSANKPANKSFHDAVDTGLTVFCASDALVTTFLPKYNALNASSQLAILLFHAVPEYNSMVMLQTTNALTNTLATKTSNKYDFTVQANGGNTVSIDTKVVTAKVTGTLIDEEPLSIYKIDKVLLPKELFKAVEAPSPDSAADGSSSDQKNGSFRIIVAYGWVTFVFTLIYAAAFL